MINRAARAAAYRQLADILRAQITSGQLAPGDLLPFEGRLAQEYQISRQTARKALELLRVEGLVVTERGYGTRVIERQPKTHIAVPRAARIDVRMPTDLEREDLGIEVGEVVPVVIVHVGAQARGPYRADLYDFTTA